MKAIAINGSPRKKWNTATLLEKAIEGAVSEGAKAESIHLYDLNFKGCISCFACKTTNGKSYGKCAVKDELTPVLKKVNEADVIILGSPIYFGTVTGEMRSFMERLLFALSTYTDPPGSLFFRKVRRAFIYTLGATEEMSRERGFDKPVIENEMVMKRIFGASETCAGMIPFSLKITRKCTRLVSILQERRKYGRKYSQSTAKKPSRWAIDWSGN